MNIKYEFVTGEKVELEVSEDIGEVSISVDKDIYNSNHRETRRHNSIENLQAQGIQIADKSEDIVSMLEKKERITALHNALEQLLPQQRELVQKVFLEEKTMADIAREEGVTSKAVQDRVNKIKIRLRKIIEKNL